VFKAQAKAMPKNKGTSEHKRQAQANTNSGDHRRQAQAITGAGASEY